MKNKTDFWLMIKSFFIKYKWDIICYSIILICFSLLSFLYWGKLGNPIIDSGREVYIPSAILKGGVLYKDILNVYGPLGYQINAAFYFIFGENLNVLYAAGTANALVIITCLYYILRLYLKEFLSMTSCLFILTLCCFSASFCCNFIFPYSYSTYYALTFFLLSVIFLFKFLKEDNKNVFISLAFLSLGISVACKIEFILFLLVLIFASLHLKPIKLKTFFAAIGLFFLVPMLSMAVLFFQGLNLQDIVAYFNFMSKYATAPSMKFFLNCAKLLPKYAFIDFYKYLQSIILFTALNCFLYLAFQLENGFNLKKLFSTIWLGCTFQIIFNAIGLEYLQVGLTFIEWLGINSLFILAILSIYYFKQLNKKIEDKLFIILVIASIITNRSLFSLNPNGYGNVTFSLTFIVNLIFWVKYVPLYYTSINTKNWQKASAIIILCASLSFGISYFFSNTKSDSLGSRIFSLQTRKGTIYVEKDKGYCLKETLDYITTNFPEDASFVMYPEGPLLNFITNRPSNNNFYVLIPPEVEALGEKFILENFSLNAPDYIMINSQNQNVYGCRYFGKDYAKEIMKFVDKEYILAKIIEQPFTEFNIRIYKSKKL